MDKYILKDGSAIEIDESNNTASFTKIFATPEEYLSTLQLLKKSNLEQYQQQNYAGLVCANPKNKECVSHFVETKWDADGNITEFRVTFYITDVDMIRERLTSAEETLDVLMADYLGLEVQNG